MEEGDKGCPMIRMGVCVCIPAATNVVVCRAHSKPSCQECLVFKSLETHTCNAMLSSEAELKCGCVLPVIADACKTKESGLNCMPVIRGRLHDKEVNVLRDTGCSTVVVRRDLVPDEALTGKTIVLIDGTAGRMPTAMIDIETQFYTGRIEAVCMKNPIYELIIGNVIGVSNEPEMCEVADDNTKRKDVVQTQAVD